MHARDAPKWRGHLADNRDYELMCTLINMPAIAYTRLNYARTRVLYAACYGDVDESWWPPSSDEERPLEVRLLVGETMLIDFDEAMFVDDLFDIIAEQHRVEADVILVFKGSSLPLGKRLIDCGVRGGDRLDMTLRAYKRRRDQ